MLLVFGVCAALVTLEGIARLTFHAGPPKGGYSPVRGHRATEPRNAAGYRDVEHRITKSPGVHRAVFIGDSFTFGAGILLDDTYAKRAERALTAARAETWEAVVMAVPGIDTEEEATILENEAFKYSPDLVVLGYVLNDAENVDAAERRRALEWAEAEAAIHNPPWWKRSALLSFVGTRLHATLENRRRIQNHLALYQEGAPGFRAAKRSLETMESLCRAHGVPFVVVIFPLFANPLDATYPFAGVHEQVKQACPQGSTVIDLLPYYRDLDWRLLVVEGERDEHPNEIAHRIAAQALVSTLNGSVLQARGSGATLERRH